MAKAYYSPKAPKGSKEWRLWKSVWDDHYDWYWTPGTVRDYTLEFDQWGHPIEKERHGK